MKRNEASSLEDFEMFDSADWKEITNLFWEVRLSNRFRQEGNNSPQKLEFKTEQTKVRFRRKNKLTAR